jgi:hypothetical protein
MMRCVMSGLEGDESATKAASQATYTFVMQKTSQTPNSYIEKLIKRLDDCYAGLHSASTLDLPLDFAKKHTFDTKEAEYFMRGLEEGIFSIDEEGYAQSICLPLARKVSTRQRDCQLFWHRSGKRYLFREGVCQLATVSELELEYKWPREQIEMEPRFPEYPHLNWAVDIALRDTKKNIVAACEVKRDNQEFTKMVKGFQNCCGREKHTKVECKSPKNHSKYEFCAAYQPKYFMVASPGQQVAFRMKYEDNAIKINGEEDHLIRPER